MRKKVEASKRLMIICFLCLACRDQSDNHAIPIANRVHAVRDANSTGDLENLVSAGSRDWSGITYPQEIMNCEACHNSINISYQTNPYEMPCYGCHADIPGAVDHFRQNGGPY